MGGNAVRGVNAFVKFGSFISNVRPLYPEKYIDYVVTSGVKLDHWARDELYEKYALEFILKEDVTTALERSIQTMLEWAAENEPAPWNHYFNHIGLNKAVWNIRDGKISPWLLLNCKSGKEMLSKFNACPFKNSLTLTSYNFHYMKRKLL